MGKLENREVFGLAPVDTLAIGLGRSFLHHIDLVGTPRN